MREIDLVEAFAVFCERYGLVGSSPASVLEVARRRGISRVRVRELEVAAVTGLKKLGWKPPRRRSA